jgi:hypothetical protein
MPMKTPAARRPCFDVTIKRKCGSLGSSELVVFCGLGLSGESGKHYGHNHMVRHNHRRSSGTRLRQRKPIEKLFTELPCHRRRTLSWI